MKIIAWLKNLLHRKDPSLMYWENLRIVLGVIFLWTFLDKTFGLGIPTTYAEAWVNGVSPTYGFLSFGTESSYFHSLFQSMAGNIGVDWLYMLGLAGVGTSLVTGMGTRVAGYAGALMMFLIWLALLPLEHNPFFDEHIVYIIVLIAFTQVPVGYMYGLREWWRKTSLVKRFPILE